jgi:hypothetical protein
MVKTKGRIARWPLLSDFNFSIEYRKGRSRGNADALSRCINPRDSQCELNEDDKVLKCGPCKKSQKRSQEMVTEYASLHCLRSSKTD